MNAMYHDQSRALQDQFGSRALADRLQEQPRIWKIRTGAQSLALGAKSREGSGFA
jgi:hypothetical protein